jgi:RNA polymerase sigma factor (sigma-70 family)
LAAVNAVGRAAGLEPLEPLGDDLAGDLYERHARRVFAYCRSRLRREDAEDAVQTTFLHAVNGLRRGVVPTLELAWLLGIARNVCLSRLDSAGRRGKLELVCDPVDLERSEAPSGRRDELIGLEDALARLPEQQRRAVLLRDWRGLSYEEVAVQLGVTLACAETLIFRGRRSLAELLQEEPARTRRRLASLGNAGSVVTWAKTSFAGAAAASKLAAATAVIVVSGAGVAAGTAAFEPDRAAPVASAKQASPHDQPTAAARLAQPGVVTPTTKTLGSARLAAAPASAASPPPKAPGGTVSQALPRAAAAPEAGSAPEKPRDTVAQGEGAAGAAAPAPVVEKVAETVATVVPAVEPVTEAVVEVVEALPIPDPPVPALPVETPPVVEQIVDAVPPVGPIAVDPPKLLP